jgi:hypothetical protein
MKIKLKIVDSDIDNAEVQSIIQTLIDNVGKEEVYLINRPRWRANGTGWAVQWMFSYWELKLNGRERYKPWFLQFKLKFGHLIEK